MLPLGGLMMAIFVGFIVKNIVEAELSLSTFIFNLWRFIIKFIAL